MTDVTIGYGTRFAIEATQNAWDFVDIKEVFEVTPPSFAADPVEATHFLSPGRMREYIQGMTDPGSASAQMNFVPGSPSDMRIRELASTAQKVYARLSFPNGTRLIFLTMIEGYEQSVTVDDRMTATVTFKVSGEITVFLPGEEEIKPIPPKDPAEGGDVVFDIKIGGATYRVHKFYKSGDLVVNTPITTEYLIIAGGGGGGTCGGGGAGGMLSGTHQAEPGTYPVDVGGGGWSITGDANGGTGGDSSVFSVVAKGGGGGAGFHGTETISSVAENGGSGGGGGGGDMDAAGQGTTGQGHAGGTGYASEGAPYIGAGGGGAGSIGGSATASAAGNGGEGAESSITGVATMYAAGGAGSMYVADTETPIVYGAGGSGIGGAVGEAGAANTGSGGGARPDVKTSSSGVRSGVGGSGVVIIRYPLPQQE